MAWWLLVIRFSVGKHKLDKQEKERTGHSSTRHRTVESAGIGQLPHLIFWDHQRYLEIQSFHPQSHGCGWTWNMTWNATRISILRKNTMINPEFGACLNFRPSHISIIGCLHVPSNHIKSKIFLAPSTLPCCKFMQILLKSLNPIILGYHLTCSLANWMFRLSEMVSMTELPSCKRTSSRCLHVNHAWKISPRIVDKWRQLIIDWLGSPKS